jgi:beta-lactam-binding protein with PASTA domain
MGMAVRSAADLGLVVEYQIDQRNPDFDHGDVISIMPPAGTLVLRGSTVVVRINLEG